MNIFISNINFPKTSHGIFNTTDLQHNKNYAGILLGSLYYILNGVKLYTKTCKLHAFNVLSQILILKKYVENFKIIPKLPNKLPNEF